MINAPKRFALKTSASLMLALLPLAVMEPRFAQAGPLGISGDYNLFVFGDITQAGTDVEGRVAAGGNVTYTGGFSIAATLPAEHGIASVVAGSNVTLSNGSVQSGLGTIVYGGAASIDASVGFGTAVQNASYIDFAAQRNYLEGLSTYWGGRTANGSVILTSGQIDLTGSDPTLNIFSLAAADILTTGLSFDFHLSPEAAGSTILVNITGSSAELRNFGTTFNSIPGENPPAPGEYYSHNAGFPYDRIVFNFPDATLLEIDRVAMNGSMLAPFAHIDFGRNSHIDGSVIAASLTGDGELHNLPFDGAVPEPGSLLLLAGGLAAMVFRRRRK